MRVQLLGCVEAHTPTLGTIRISGGAGRLLAVLSWTPGSFVPDELAIERVWEERRAPRNPRDALYILATRLRKALGENAECVIRRNGGYLLAVGEGCVDVSRFRSLVRSAAEDSRVGMDHQALRRYADALTLWRGEPLSDVRTPWADAVRVTLHHEYRDVLAGCAELALRTGRHEEYVSLLHTFTAASPFDERLTGLLMLALDRSGRRTEALELFRRTRARMIESLGCEPGPELQDVHELLLSWDEGPAEATHLGASGKWSARYRSRRGAKLVGSILSS
ncbi:AfsR/SARP family transcriptional regulator [Streptomyces sp. CC219B]|uniref:AfsR/SARP family transcriptional regulator n=1 Tax=Streptomyces sp. CC219B TaxID=3044574 RepID=UPI0024A941E7|nr:AfsR/SARP family transcriptional regulator [Streptomyces sp. CC219B]